MALRKKRQVLVIDDDAATRVIVKVALEKAGFAVAACRNGKEGVALFQERKFNCVITDMSMPVMDGVDAIVQMRKVNSAVPIIAISGAERKLSFLKMADFFTADATLQKPFDPAELAAIVEKTASAG